MNLKNYIGGLQEVVFLTNNHLILVKIGVGQLFDFFNDFNSGFFKSVNSDFLKKSESKNPKACLFQKLQHDTPLSLSNGIQGKELVGFWFQNKMQIQVFSLIPKRKKGMKHWDGTTTNSQM